MLRALAVTLWTLTGATAGFANTAQDCSKAKDPDLKIKACTTIIDGSGNLAWPYYSRGNAHRAKNDYERAIADYTKAVELNPKDHNVYRGRALAYFNSGKAVEGLQDAEKSLELLPNDAWTLSIQGSILEALGRKEEAIVSFRRALSRDRGNQASKDGLKRLGVSP
jgi:tetratricopeptide (TPR) repeat protein